MWKRCFGMQPFLSEIGLSIVGHRALILMSSEMPYLNYKSNPKTAVLVGYQEENKNCLLQ